MIVEALKLQLLALTPEEKSQVVQWLVQSLVNNWQGITKTPGVCGGDACIAGTRIPVWVLVSYHRLGVNESELLYNYPTLSATDLANAWVYAYANPEEIDTAIRKNDEDFEEEDN